MRAKLPWLIAGVFAVACAFLSLSEVKSIAPSVVTKEVVREAPKEVVRVVTKEVAAEIPAEYKVAKAFYDSYWKAELVSRNDLLQGVESVLVQITLAEGFSEKIGERELKDRIELALRKNGVPVRENAKHFAKFSVSGLISEDKVTYSYSAKLTLSERVSILRKDGFRDSYLAIWETGYNGHAGSAKFKEGIVECADGVVTSFSNAYLGANQK